MKSISYKFYLFKKYLKEKGFSFALRRIILLLFKPLTKLIKKNIALIDFYYGTLPSLKQKLSFLRVDSGMIKFSKSELVEKVRSFWYSNIAELFNLAGEKISRGDIFTYGGPNPGFSCPTCQRSEWLSRIRQKNLFVSHFCPEAEKCKILCSRQGDELWTNFHQNFNFSVGSNPDFPAPKGLLVLPEDKNSVFGGFYQHFLIPGCDQWMLVFKRRIAYVSQVDIVRYPSGINWSKYDFVFVPNAGVNQRFPRPPIPVIMYGHDFWPLEDKIFQRVIDWLEPDVLLTPYPTQWKQYFKLPEKTKVVFYPFFDSIFFARPNLGNKKLDLLVIGATASSVYKRRIPLDKQISQLINRYQIEFSHKVGAFGTNWEGPVYYIDHDTKSPVYYLNKWSEYLGSAKYVIFGKMQFPILVSKYYEVLGSGAIPIFPEAPDLKLLGLKPFEHYIPLSEIEGNNEKLAYFLDHYDDFKYIAKNAIEWYKRISDKMIFNDFEDLIGEITDSRFPKRLI